MTSLSALQQNGASLRLQSSTLAFKRASGAPATLQPADTFNKNNPLFWSRLDPGYDDLYNYFTALVKIASPSPHEENVRNYCIRQIESMGIAPAGKKSGLGNYHVDKAGNLIIDLPSPLGHKVVLTGHMDTVQPTADGLEPLVTGEGKDRTFYAPKGYVLGADDKSALGPYLKVLQLVSQNRSAPRPHIVCILTTGEEVDFHGSKNVDKNWYRDAELILCFDHTGVPGDYIFHKAPLKEDEHVIVQGAVPLRKRVGNRIFNLFHPKRDFTIQEYGVSAHAAAEPEKGRNAALALMMGLGGALKDPQLKGVRFQINALKSGLTETTNLNVVPDKASATIRITGRRPKIQKALSRLEQHLKTANNRIGTRSEIVPLKKPPGDVGNSEARSAAYTLLALAFSSPDIPNGRQKDGGSCNLGYLGPKGDNGAIAGFDFRVFQGDSAGPIVAVLRRRLEEARQTLPGVTFQFKPFNQFKGRSAPEDHPAYQKLQKAIQQALSVNTPIPYKAANGLSDLNPFCQVDSTLYPGMKVAGAELSNYHGPHQPGDGVLKDGKYGGESASVWEMGQIVKIILSTLDQFTDQSS